MEKLVPREIEVDILSRLPAETLIPSKRVCRTWRRLFRDNHFIDVHLRRQSIGFEEENEHSYYHKKRGSSRSSDSEDADTTEPIIHRRLSYVKDANSSSKVTSFLILGGSYVQAQNKSFYYGIYSDEKQHFTYKKLKATRNDNHLFTPNSEYSVVGSCNGLICFSASYFSELFINKDPVYACNPITGEEFNLPRFMVNYQSQEALAMVNIASGFGYVPLTNQYKVVRICYYGREALLVQVYTLGGSGSDEGWRTFRGDFDCLMPTDLTASPGVYANGALYWLNSEKDSNIVAFDLAKEEFHIIQPPSEFSVGKRHSYRLQVLGGCLCFVHQRRGRYVNIWSLEKRSSNNNNRDNSSSQINGFWNWTREFKIVWDAKWVSEYEPFALTERGHVLFWFNRTILSLYDAKAKSVTKLMDGGDLGFKNLQAVPHINSFVSLKALGM
ncbi:F-box protein At3g07870-like [Papaver somniferum]|uniref:F-box protein At3g07870-like n=1 Tax=Papaver somniferum TaxID=3469 RepID=UPI000E6FF195|nr:F-box protein At3g07870-like [Papaver somniferum]